MHVFTIQCNVCEFINHDIKTHKIYREKRIPIIADGNSVSTFLCTRNLGPEEVSLTPV